jgi:nitrogen-specific signal transduction histidine kinase
MITDHIPVTGNHPGEPSDPGLSLVEYAPLPMALVEGAGHIIRYINPAFCHLIENSKDKLIGTPFCEWMPKNDKCVTVLDGVFCTGKPASHTEEEHSRTHPFFWSYTMWPVMAEESPRGVMIQVTETAHFHEKTLAMNEALILGSVRQHELTEAADRSNTQLLAEIGERKQIKEALQQAQAELADRAGQLERLVAERTAELTATNKRLAALVHSPVPESKAS